jgi:purine-binding chemotaxis protein CheW
MSEANGQELAPVTGKAIAGKYLTFAIADEHFGVEILKVIEIIGVMQFTRVPRCPPYMKGVINLRGKIIPVVDLRMKFGLPEIPYDEKTCTIITKVRVGEGDIAIGMIVDTVLEVVNFEPQQIENAPDFGVNLDSRFILGMGKVQDGRVTILVDISQVFSDTERSSLGTIATGE